MAGVLMLDPAPARELAAFAAARENWWVPGKGPPPGDDERYVRQLGTFRVAFSWTVTGDGVFRHLSVSKVPSQRGRFPNEIVVYTIASWLGFTGGVPLPGQADVVGAAAEDWAMSIGRDERHIVVMQLVPGAKP